MPSFSVPCLETLFMGEHRSFIKLLLTAAAAAAATVVSVEHKPNSKEWRVSEEWVSRKWWISEAWIPQDIEIDPDDFTFISFFH